MKLIITGALTEEDLKEFARTLRKIERKNPEEHYFFIIEDADMKIEEAKKLVKKVAKSAELPFGG
jgi:hypothetical protein